MQPAHNFVAQFVQHLRGTAEQREAEGASTARVYGLIAQQLESEWHAWMTAPLTVREAAAESGYSRSTLQTIRQRNGGVLRRCDLPLRAADEPAVTVQHTTIDVSPLALAHAPVRPRASLAQEMLVRRAGRGGKGRG